MRLRSLILYLHFSVGPLISNKGIFMGVCLSPITDLLFAFSLGPHVFSVNSIFMLVSRISPICRETQLL